MFEFSNSEYEQIIDSLKFLDEDLTSIGCLFDTMKADLRIKNGQYYVTNNRLDSIYSGYAERMYERLNFIKGVFYSKDYSLDLQ